MSQATYDDDWGLRPRRKGSGALRLAGGLLGLLILAGIAWVLAHGPSIDERANDRKVIRVALPPPPPPPPPKPIEKPPEPKPVPKEVEQPTPQTPPPTPQPQTPTPTTNDALTARAGAAPGNYNLARGDGGGRIGGTPGNGAFTAYAGATFDAARRAVQGDPALTKDRYVVRVAVTVGPDGGITEARILESSGDARRDAEIQRVLLRIKTTPPPPGMPMPIRLELNARTSF